MRPRLAVWSIAGSSRLIRPKADEKPPSCWSEAPDEEYGRPSLEPKLGCLPAAAAWRSEVDGWRDTDTDERLDIDECLESDDDGVGEDECEPAWT